MSDEENTTPEPQDSSPEPENNVPPRNYDEEHYKGHHDRLLLGHQDECDMCRTVKRNDERSAREAEIYRKRLEAAGVDPNDRDAVEHYQKHIEQEETDQMRMRRHRGEEEPNSMPSPEHRRDDGPTFIPRRVEDHSDSAQFKQHNPFDKDTHGTVDGKYDNPHHDEYGEGKDGWENR
jgi:hypothetical protein